MNPHPVPLPLSTNYHPYPYGVAVGELALIGAVSGLYAFWLWFWRFSYDRQASYKRVVFWQILDLYLVGVQKEGFYPSSLATYHVPKATLF